MVGDTLLYPNIELIIKQSNLPLWLDFSNILLEKSDFYDVMSNVILKLLPNNYIFEISNLDLLNYINMKFPNLKYVISKNANILYPLTPDIINNFHQNLNPLYVIIPNEFKTSQQYLNEINNKENIVIPVNNLCNPECKNYFQCPIVENNNILNYTFEPTFCNCKNSINNKQYITIKEIKDIYIPMGITNFLIDYFSNNENEYGLFLINYFIKPEFKEYAFQELFIRR